ncbi:MAG: hypothetical protein H6Q37_384, partial [Chloroflexi bacterium]|nr:hypothetical protein [Chloroflexota bacterium]
MKVGWIADAANIESVVAPVIASAES